MVGELEASTGESARGLDSRFTLEALTDPEEGRRNAVFREEDIAACLCDDEPLFSDLILPSTGRFSPDESEMTRKPGRR